jgi:hypothetical protein
MAIYYYPNPVQEIWINLFLSENILVHQDTIMIEC